MPRSLTSPPTSVACCSAGSEKAIVETDATAAHQRISDAVQATGAIFFTNPGSFYALAFVTLCGYNLAKATAHAKILNFTSNFGSVRPVAPRRTRPAS
jgi:hypothetical protein